MSSAINILVSKINRGDLSAAREWAMDNVGALGSLRSDPEAFAMVAHACNIWGAPIVWPFGDNPRPNGAHLRVLRAIQRGANWRANEDTVAVIVACGWARFVNGKWEVCHGSW